MYTIMAAPRSFAPTAAQSMSPFLGTEEEQGHEWIFFLFFLFFFKVTEDTPTVETLGIIITMTLTL